MSALDLSTNLSSLLANSPAPALPAPSTPGAAVQTTDFSQHFWRLAQPPVTPTSDPSPVPTASSQTSSDQNRSTNAANDAVHSTDRRDTSRDNSLSDRTSRPRDQHSNDAKSRKSSRNDGNRTNDRSHDVSSSKSDSPSSSADQKTKTSTSSDKPAAKDNAKDTSPKSTDDAATAVSENAVLVQAPVAPPVADSEAIFDLTGVQTTDNANASQTADPTTASTGTTSATNATATVAAQTAAAAAKDTAQATTIPTPAENAVQSQAQADAAGNAKIVDGKKSTDEGSKSNVQNVAVDPSAASVQAGITSTQIASSDQLGEKTQSTKSETSSGRRDDKTGAAPDDNATTSIVDQVLAAFVPPVATTTVTSVDSKTSTDDAGKAADRTTSAIDRAADKTPVDAKNAQSNTPVKLTATGGQAAKPGEMQASTLSEADRARFVQRVSRAVQSSDAQNGPVKIRLSPPELGSMKIEVVVKDGVMSAKVETETSQARTALLDNLPQLRERLAEQNIKVERFDVDLMNQQPQGGMPDQRFADATATNRNRVRGSGSTAAGEAVAAPGSTPVNNGQLNIVI